MTAAVISRHKMEESTFSCTKERTVEGVSGELVRSTAHGTGPFLGSKEMKRRKRFLLVWPLGLPRFARC